MNLSASRQVLDCGAAAPLSFGRPVAIRKRRSSAAVQDAGARQCVRAATGATLFPITALLFASTACAATLEWQAGQGFRSAALAVPPADRSGFTLLAPASTGIAFTNALSASRHLTNQILLNGSGVAAGDVDGDGWCDLYFCGLDGPNMLYRNLGNWRFQNIATNAGVDCPNLDATGAAFADLDGDRDLDLVVNSVGGGTHVFFNDGKGRFTAETVLNPGRCGTSLALGDLDGDGFLDLYIANYRTSALMDMPNTRFLFQVVGGKQVVWKVNGRLATAPDLTNRFMVTARGGIEELGEADVLYRNVAGTNFVAMPFTDGGFLDEDGQPLKEPPFDWGLSVVFRDLNGDGRPDIYVCNDFDSPDRVWINQGNWKFRALPRLALRKTSLFSMGIDFADINRDGFDDFFVLDMLTRHHTRRMDTMPDRKASSSAVGEIDTRRQYSLNTLFLSRGGDTWSEIGQLAGVAAAEWAWATAFLDVDLDGYEDLLITNGNERDARSMDIGEQLRKLRTNQQLSNEQILQNRRLFSRLDTANIAFRNRGDLTFEDVSERWGFNLRGVSHGLALADLDNDGDLDVVVNNLNAAAAIYRNESPAPRLAVRLKGKAPNTEGIGARITVSGGAVSSQSQETIAGGRYVSDDDTLRVFAAGLLSNEMRIEVLWRSGQRSVIAGAQPNRIYDIDEGSVTANSKLETRNSKLPLFTDVSHLLQHTHTDEPFDDHARQPTLPNRLSQSGPGVSWFDCDGDGWDDLIIGGGKSGRIAVYRNDGQGGFKLQNDAPFDIQLLRDQTTILGWQKAPGQTMLLAGSANWEDGLAEGACVQQFDLFAKRVNDSLPASEASTGPLALADIDNDGDLDLFVGGRCVAGRYPAAPVSVLFRNHDRQFQLDPENSAQLTGVGMVSGAVFSDLDGDGDSDLILACDWGPIRIFGNERGKLAPWNPSVRTFVESRESKVEGSERHLDARPSTLDPQSWTLDQFTGWWNGVTVGDFDGDGRMDIVASNWGRNTQYEAHRSQPLVLFHADFDGDGHEEVIEAFHDAALQKVVPVQRLDFMARAMPFLRERFTSNQAWGRASAEEIFADPLKSARRLEAVWLESTVFLNRGDHFEAKPLPVEAQLAPAFGVCVADFDGDGNEDIFLAQNFFATLPETPRYDAGVGLCLRGDGLSTFSPVSARESGLSIPGEQRGCATGDYDADGRTDLVVSQNGAATKLFRNTDAQPGLRVRLKGSAGNSSGIGTQMRLVTAGKMGPTREVRGGGGYWSQDSAVQVLSGANAPRQIWVRWPGGESAMVNVPASAKEVLIEAPAILTVVR